MSARIPFATPLAVSFITLGAVFPLSVFASGTLSFSPASGSYHVGDSVSLRVMIDSSEPISGAEGKVTFDAHAWQVDIASVADVSGWVEKPTVKDGVVEFSALLNSKTPIRKSELFTINAKALRVGSQSFHFDSAATVAADGTGGNVLGTVGEASFDLTPGDAGATEITSDGTGKVLGLSTDDVTSDTNVTIDSPDIIDPAKWYTVASTSVRINVPAGITRVHLGITKKSTDAGYRAIDVRAATSSATSTVLIRPIDKLDEGEWWYHVTPDSPGATTTHFRLAIDRTAPELLDPSVRERTDMTDPHFVIIWNATDTISGITSVTAAWDNGAPTEVKPMGSIIELVAPSSGQTGAHKLKLTATDAAGNRSEVEIPVKVDPIVAPQISLKGEAREAEPLLFTIHGNPSAKVDIDFFGGGIEHKDTIVLNGAGIGEWKLAEHLLPAPYQLEATQSLTNGARSNVGRLDVQVVTTIIGYLGRNLAITFALLISIFVIFVVTVTWAWKRYMGEGGNPTPPTLALPAPSLSRSQFPAPQVVAPVAIMRKRATINDSMLKGDVVDLRSRNK